MTCSVHAFVWKGNTERRREESGFLSLSVAVRWSPISSSFFAVSRSLLFPHSIDTGSVDISYMTLVFFNNPGLPTVSNAKRVCSLQITALLLYCTFFRLWLSPYESLIRLICCVLLHQLKRVSFLSVPSEIDCMLRKFRRVMYLQGSEY